MTKLDIPVVLKKDTYQVSNGSAGPTPWECKGSPPGGDAKSAGSGWCRS